MHPDHVVPFQRVHDGPALLARVDPTRLPQLLFELVPRLTPALALGLGLGWQHLDYNGVCNYIAGTSGLTANAALQGLTS